MIRFIQLRTEAAWRARKLLLRSTWTIYDLHILNAASFYVRSLPALWPAGHNETPQMQDQEVGHLSISPRPSISLMALVHLIVSCKWRVFVNICRFSQRPSISSYFIRLSRQKLQWWSFFSPKAGRSVVPEQYLSFDSYMMDALWGSRNIYSRPRTKPTTIQHLVFFFRKLPGYWYANFNILLASCNTWGPKVGKLEFNIRLT